MPDFLGKLSPDEKDVVVAWLAAHWNRTECPFHVGPTQWEIGDAIATQAFAGKGGGVPGSGFQFGSPTYPLIVLTCAICGYTVLLNAIKLGIVLMSPEPPTTPATDPPATTETG
jgi:hypothetical protein